MIFLSFVPLTLLVSTVFTIEKFRRFHVNETISTRIVLRCPLAWSDDDVISFYQRKDNGESGKLFHHPELKDSLILDILPEPQSSHYQCRCEHKKDKSTETVDFYIDRKGTYRDIQKLKYSSEATTIKEIKLGDSLSFTCQKEQKGMSDYIWFGPDLLQLNNSQINFEIGSSVERDFGEYFCGRVDDVKDGELPVGKFVVKLSSIIYDTSIKNAAKILTYPTYKLGEQVIHQPSTAFTLTRRLIWEFPPETVLLNQGRDFNREIFTHDMTREEFYYRETDRIDPNHIAERRVLFQSQKMGSQSFSVDINPTPASVILGNSIELACNNTNNLRAVWYYKDLSGSAQQDLPAGVTTRVEGTFTIAKINSSEIHHSGTYICDAKKGIAEVVLTVKLRPKLTVSPTEIVIRPGSSARFLCQLLDATGTVIWRRKDKKSFQMQVESRIGGDTQAILVVQLAPKELNGSIYECVHNGIVVESLLMVKDICPSDKRACRNGECVDESQFCNQVKDCSDESDEDIVMCAQCEPNQRACMKIGSKMPLQKCVIQHWFCDGDNDCGNGYDEQNCTQINKDTCISTHFACNDNRTLIPRSLWCDKSVNCPNGDDEVNCRPPEVVLPSKETTYVVHTNSSISLLCEVVSVPTSSINWRYNWGNLPQKLNFTISQTGSDCNRIRNTLTIHNMHPDFAGVYTCEAISSARAMAKDYTIFVTSKIICKRPYFNNAAWFEEMCLKCYCSNVTDDCTSASGYFQSPTHRVSAHTRAVLMNFMTKKIMETGISKSLYDPATKVYKFYDQSYSSFVMNPSMYLTSNFGLSGSWIESYSYYMIIKFKVTGLQFDDIRGPAVVLQSSSGKSLHWCRSDNSPVVYSADSGYFNTLKITLWEKENWYNNIACSDSSTRVDVLKVLTDVSRILIRIKYYTNQTGFEFHNITLEHAIPATKAGETGVLVPRIEMCKCPYPYTGLSCEKCVEGYSKDSKNKCVKICPMNCEECLEKGECIKCKGYRSGAQCLECRAGFMREVQKNMLENCVECPCERQSNDTIIVNECSQDITGNGNIQCKCTGKEINDASCNKCLQTTLSPEDEKKCTNQTKTANPKCHKYGTVEILDKMCKCKVAYKGEFCTECEAGHFQHGGKCLKCFCSNTNVQCQASTDFKFENLTLNSKDYTLAVKLTNRLLSGVYDSEINVGDLKVNRTKNKIVVKRNPNGKGLVYVTITASDTENPASINTYTMMYGGKIMFKFEYITDKPGRLYFNDVTPFLEIESSKFGRLWTPFKYNDETKFMEAIFSEDFLPTWRLDKDNSIVDRETLIRALMTTQYLLIGFPFDNDVAKKVRIGQLTIEHAKKDMEPGVIAPVEKCLCTSVNSGIKCEACDKQGFESVLSLSPNLPDFVCGQCNSPACSKCADGTYNYDFLLNKNFSSCQQGIEITTKGRVISVHRGEHLSIPCSVKSYKGGIAIHQWTKMDTLERPNTFRHLTGDMSHLIMNFNEIKLSDSGYYKCEARNAISNVSEEFYITVINEPVRLKVDIMVTSEPMKNIKFNVSLVSPKSPTDYKVIWSVVKDGKTTTEESYKVKVTSEKSQYNIDVEVTANLTDGVQLRGLVVGSRVTNPFYYEIRHHIKQNISIQIGDVQLSTDKNILNLKFLETGIVNVITSPHIRTETFWYKISDNGTEMPLPYGITRRGSELIVWSASESHNGKYVGYVINTADGNKIGKVHTEIRVSPMSPDVGQEMFNISQTSNMSIPIYVPLTIYCPNQIWEVHNLKTVKDITKNVTRISDKQVVINYPLILGDIIRFRCFVIFEANVTGEIKISLESKYPIIDIIPKYEASNYPTSLECIDKNTVYKSNITWYFNGNLMGNNATIDWRSLGGFSPHIHEGIYTCFVTNSQNNATKAIQIPVKSRSGTGAGSIKIVSSTNPIITENGTLRLYIIAGQKFQVGAEIIGFEPLGTNIEWFINNVTVQPNKTGQYFSSLEIFASTSKEYFGTYRVQVRLRNGTLIVKTFEVLPHNEANYYAKIDGLNLNGDLIILEGDSHIIGCKLIRKEGGMEMEEQKAKISWLFTDSLGKTLQISDIPGFKASIDERTVYISNAQSTLNRHRGQCQINFNGELYMSKYFSFDVNQRNIDLRVKLMGLEGGKYIVDEEGSTTHVICQAYDENAKRLLLNAEYKWEMTFSSQNRKVNWEKMIIDNNKITFGGLIYHKVSNSAVGRCRVNYFNNIIYSDEFTFNIKRKDTNVNLPKLKIDITYDIKTSPYPVSVACRDSRVNATSNMTLTVTNTNFERNMITTKPGWLYINFTSNGSSFNPYNHSGLYTFNATNEFGYKFKQILLPQYKNPHANYSANIVIYSTTGKIENDRIRVKSNSDIKLLCAYYGHPFPKSLQWKLEKHENPNVVIESTDYWTSVSIVGFNSVTNSGEYECSGQSHQGALSKKVIIEGYSSGIKVEVLDEKGNQMPKMKPLKQGETFVIKYRGIDLFTNTEIKNLKGIWEFRYSRNDNFTEVTPSTFPKEQVDFSETKMTISEVSRTGEFEIRCKFQNKSDIFVSESVIVNVEENVDVHPEPHFMVTYANNSIYPTKLKCLDTVGIPSVVNITKVTGLINEELQYTSRPKEQFIEWKKRPFSPYYDIGTYKCEARGRYKNMSTTINLPEERDRVLNMFVKFESKINEIVLKENMKTINIIDGSKFMIICNYYGSRAPISDVEIILESKSGEAKAPVSFASRFSTKTYYSEISIDKFDMSKHSGRYTCRSRNLTHELKDTIHVNGLNAGFQVVVEGLDSDNNLKLMLGSTRSFKCSAFDPITKKPVPNVKYDWKLESLQGQSFDIDDLSETIKRKEGNITLSTVKTSEDLRGKCEATKNGTFSSNYFEITIVQDAIKKPKLTFVEKPGSGERGLPLSLHCTDERKNVSEVKITRLSGNAPEMILNKKNNMAELIFPSNISNPMLYVGSYRCDGVNKFGEDWTIIDINYKPQLKPLTVLIESKESKIVAKHEVKTLEIPIGKRMEIDCIYSGDNLPIVTDWYLTSNNEITKIGRDQPIKGFSVYQKRSDCLSIIQEGFNMKGLVTLNCTAKDNSGVIRSDSLQITTIIVGTRIELSGLDNETNTSGKQGSEKTLMCKVVDLNSEKDISKSFTVKWVFTDEKGQEVKVNELADNVNSEDGKLRLMTLKNLYKTLTGYCFANNGTNNFTSTIFTYIVKEDEDKRPKLSFEEIYGENKKFPSKLQCTDERDSSSNLTAFRTDGKQLPQEWISKMSKSLTITFPLKDEDFLPYQGPYKCQATNKFGSGEIYLQLSTRELLSVVLNSTINKIESDNKGNLSTIVRKNRKLELNCYVTGMPLPKIKFSIITDAYNPDLPVPSRKIEIMPNDINSPYQVEVISKKHYRLSRMYYSQSPPSSFSCEASLDEKTVASKVKVEEVSDIFKVDIISEQPNQLYQVAYLEKSLKIGCKMLDNDKKPVKIQTLKWEFKNLKGVDVDLEKLAKTVNTKNNTLILDGLTMTYGDSVQGRCVAFYNDTYDTRGDEFNIKIKESPKIVSIYVEYVLSGARTAMDLPNNFTYDSKDTSQVTCKTKTTGDLKPSIYWIKCLDPHCNTSEVIVTGDTLIFFEGNTKYTDAGIYHCIVKLDMTEKIGKMFILRRAPPKQHTMEMVESKHSLSLSCDNEFSSPEGNVTWSFIPAGKNVEEMIPSSASIITENQVSTLTIDKPMKTSYSGKYICKVVNDYGTGGRDFIVKAEESFQQRII